jgi:SAM-dependent methyltransferase
MDLTVPFALTTELDISRVERGRLLRHASLPDGGLLGCVVPERSWVNELLDELRVPRTLAMLDECFGRDDLSDVVAELKRGGLVFEGPDQEALFVARGRARSILRAVRDVAGDLDAFDPTSLDEDISEALVTALEAVERSRAKLLARRRPYMERQLVAHTARAGAAATHRLNIGCGDHPITGWTNLDLRYGDVRMDLTWGLPLPDDSVEFAYSAHVLEHLTYREEALALVREIRRVLAPGGVLRLVVPDIEQCIRAYASGDEGFFAKRREYWSWACEAETRLESFLPYAGASCSPLRGVGHKFGYDFDTLATLLQAGGFAHVSRSHFQGSDASELRIDDHSVGATFVHASGHYSLFVEGCS